MKDTQFRAFNRATPGMPDGDALGDFLNASAGGVELVVGVEASHVIIVTGQVIDQQGNDLPGVQKIKWWLSNTTGGTLTGTGPATSTVVSQGTALDVLTAKISGYALTDVNGAFALTLADPGTPTFFLNVECNGVISSSSAITFA